MNDTTDKKTCCICHKEFTGWGNNPDPYPTEDGNDCCCDECNWNFVIPTRLRDMNKRSVRES